MAKIGFFNDNSEKYDKWFDKENEIFNLELEVLKKFIPQDKIGIEIGVGTGRFAESLGIKIGIEPSFQMGKIAIERGIDVVGGIAESLPVRSDSFDSVFINTVLCFLDSPEKAITESYRILKPKGVFVIGMIDKSGYLGEKYEKRKNKKSFYASASFMSISEVSSILSETGFLSPEYLQVLIRNKEGNSFSSDIESGFGKGSYVAIKCIKP